MPNNPGPNDGSTTPGATPPAGGSPSGSSGTDNLGTFGVDSVSGKYILFHVPSYEDTGDDANKDTYLNLGRGMGGGQPLPGWYPAKWDGSGLDDSATTTRTSGDDLLVDFGGFVDDTRLRGKTEPDYVAEGMPPNETVARTPASGPYSAPNAVSGTTGSGRNLGVTATIPDYVGWRDHTDGHRITTTRGDKIEIIGGNYKIVSLGRGQGVAQYEMSGGLIVDGDAAPGSLTSVSWRECPTEDDLTAAEKALIATTDPTAKKKFGWKAVEQVYKGNTVERFHGTRREEFYGDKLISVTGSPEEKTTGIGLGANGDGSSRDGTHELVSTASESVAWPSLSPSNRPTTEALPSKWDESGGLPPKLQQPDIYESTWAKSITGYTCAGTIVEHTDVAGAFIEHIHVVGDHTGHATFDGDYRNTTRLGGYGKKFIETWQMQESMGFFEYFQGAMTQFFFGASTTMGFANRFEIFVGVEEQLNVGGFIEMKGPWVFELAFGPKTELETQSYKFWLAREDTGLEDTKVALAETTARLNQTLTVLNTTGSGLSKRAMFVLHNL